MGLSAEEANDKDKKEEPKKEEPKKEEVKKEEPKRKEENSEDTNKKENITSLGTTLVLGAEAAGEFIGATTLSALSFISVIMQSDTPLDRLDKAKSSADSEYSKSAEHKKKTPSKEEKHQKGQERKDRDHGGEKGDVRRRRYK